MLSSQDRDFGYSTAFKDSAMLILPIRRFIKKLTATANNIVQTNAKRKLRGVIRIAKVSKSITTICITIQWNRMPSGRPMMLANTDNTRFSRST